MRGRSGTVLGLAVLLAGCGKEEATKKAAADAAAAVPVVVGKVEQRTVPVYSESTARTDAEDTVEIRARVGAYLQAIHFQEGTLVRKGQLLFTLDKREYEAQLNQAKAALAKAEADLLQARDRSPVESAAASLAVAKARLSKADQDVARLKPLAEQKAVPQQDYDNALVMQQGSQADIAAQTANLNKAAVAQDAAVKQAEAAVAIAKAQILQAELNVEYCNITSPIDGIIGKREVAPGNLVGRGEATLLATVSKVNPLRVFLSISEPEYLKFAEMRKKGELKGGGVPLEMMLADGSTFPFKGRVVVADRAVDLKTGTLTLIAEFPNPDNILRPGQFARVRYAAETAENALLVPQKAVADLQSAKVVYVVGQDNKVQLRTVTLGQRFESYYIVTDGLKAGETIIVEGIQKVRPGASVTPSERPATIEKGATKG